MGTSTVNQTSGRANEPHGQIDQMLDRAQRAVDAARAAMDDVDRATGATPQQSLVKSLGFPSYERLLANSSPIQSNDGKSWFVTSLSDGSWVPWNETDFGPDRHFSDKQEAVASIPQNSGPGSSLLG